MSSKESQVMLERLAAALECSVDEFIDPRPSKFDDVFELLSLWLATEHEPTRMKVLEVLRGAADDFDIAGPSR